LENLRFHPEEETNDPFFAQALAHLADIYLDDAFGSAHRAHASIVGVAGYLPAVAGFLLEKELKIMGEALNAPVRPFAVLIGGAKVSDKIDVLRNILPKVDSLLLGGGMACTFLKAKGYEVGLSLVEEDKLSFAREVLGKSTQSTRLFLPVDVVVAQRFESHAPLLTVPVAEVPQNYYIMDIGPQTLRWFAAELQGAKTIIWNGPMGVYEMPPFAEGTRAMVGLLASLKGVTTIIGGGSTADAVEAMDLTLSITHVSTGGGASLKLLEGKTLPGVAVLMDKEK
jgi:phosphoglycerate kinase